MTDTPAHHGPVLSHDGGERLLDLIRTMQRLRGEDGCPWDREQTHQSLGRHLLEEAHETLEAIDSGDPDRLKDELGDLLLQVVFHAEMGRQEGTFDVDDVAQGIVTKLVRRHPHVFGEAAVDSAAEVLVNWERIKQEERGE
ncbi:MAG TPA: MazG family protein, partial [Actinomycetota bacterium]|nr:MazG family protein [Actinomycetota bacterium]